MRHLLGGRAIRRAALPAAVCTLVSVGVTSPAHAFCRTVTKALPPTYSPTRGCFTEGLPLYWKNACVSYSIQRDATSKISLEEATRVIDTAFATWNAVTCGPDGTPVGIQTSNLGPVDCAEVRYNPDGPNQNVIVFRGDWPYDDASHTLGLTTVTFNSENGEIYDADLEINASEKLSTSDPPPSNGFDLQSVITHEAGHFLGLAHATDNKATMFASYKPGTTTLRSLTADDVEGICTIYPNAATRSVAATVAPTGLLAADPCDATPRHGFTSSCATAKKEMDKGCSVQTSRASGPGAGVLTLGALVGITLLRRARSRVRM